MHPWCHVWQYCSANEADNSNRKLDFSPISKRGQHYKWFNSSTFCMLKIAAAFLPRHLIPFGVDVTYLLNDFRILQRTALCLRFYLPLQNLTSNRVDATWNVKPPTHPNGFSVPVHHNTRFAFVFVVVDVTSAPIHLRVARRMYTMKLPELFSKCAHRVKHMRWFQQSATQRNESGKWKKFCDFLPFVWARPPASWEKCCACALRCSVSAVFFSRFDA